MGDVNKKEKINGHSGLFSINVVFSLQLRINKYYVEITGAPWLSLTE